MVEVSGNPEQNSVGDPVVTAANAPPQSRLVRQRRWWWVGLIAAVSGPVAHLYCGRFRRAATVALFTMLASLGALLALAQIPGDFVGWGIGAVLLVAAYFGCIADAVLLARRTPDSPRQWCQRWWCYIGTYVLLMGLNIQAASLFRTFAVEAFVVPTRAMADTILAGDRVIVNKWAYVGRPIQRGDVVVARIVNWNHNVVTVRVIGLPGDVISMTDERVLVNGVLLDEPYVKLLPMEEIDERLSTLAETTIPAGEVFLMGDTRRRSYDSRLYGSQPIQNVLGKVSIVYWSMVLSTPDEPDRLERGEVWDPQPDGTIRWSRIGRQVNH